VADQIEDDLIAFTDLAIITDLRYHNEYQIIKALAAKHRWKFIWVSHC